MKILNLILAAVFFLFAALQCNDPDPLVWMLTYSAVGTLCVIAALGGHFRWVVLGLGLALMAWMLSMLPGVIGWVNDGMPSIAGAMKAETPHIESVREFLGLLLAVAALVHLWRLGKRPGDEA